MNVHRRNVLHLKIKRLKVIIILESIKTIRNSHLTSESVCWGSNWLLLLTNPLGWWCWCEEYHYSMVSCSYKQWQLHYVLQVSPPVVRSDKYFVSFSPCNPTTCSHWLTQSQKEDDIYYLFIIGWHTLYFSSYWLSFIDLPLLHMSRLWWKLVLVEN